MQDVAILILVACLLALPDSSSAQNADPFPDPFGVDPFGGGKTKPPAAKAPKTKNLAQPKVATSKTTAKAKTIPARASSSATLRIRAALDDETTQLFLDLPLEEAAEQLSETHNVPIVIDRLITSLDHDAIAQVREFPDANPEAATIEVRSLR